MKAIKVAVKLRKDPGKDDEVLNRLLTSVKMGFCYIPVQSICYYFKSKNEEGEDGVTICTMNGDDIFAHNSIDDINQYFHDNS